VPKYRYYSTWHTLVHFALYYRAAFSFSADCEECQNPLAANKKGFYVVEDGHELASGCAIITVLFRSACVFLPKYLVHVHTWHTLHFSISYRAVCSFSPILGRATIYNLKNYAPAGSSSSAPSRALFRHPPRHYN
jgi:hypothetical protein